MSVLGLEHSPSKADVKEKVDIYCMSGYIMHLNFYL